MPLLRLTFALLLAGPLSCSMAQDFDAVEIGVAEVAERVYMLTGRGGNIGLVVTDQGAFLIDDQYAPLTDRIVQAIAGVTDQPVRFVLNTHWHGDHTGGNENLGQAGALIIAHDRVRTRLQAGQFMEFFQIEVPPAADGALPVVTFSEEITFHLGGHTIHAFHVAHAHTDGDSIVHLREADVIHTGDIVFYGMYPFIDAGSGGSLDGMIEAVERILRLAGPDTRIISGHGPVIDRDQLGEYHRMLRTVRQRLDEAIARGMNLEAIQAATITAEFDEAWGGGFISSERWVEMLYRARSPRN